MTSRVNQHEVNKERRRFPPISRFGFVPGQLLLMTVSDWSKVYPAAP